MDNKIKALIIAAIILILAGLGLSIWGNKK